MIREVFYFRRNPLVLSTLKAFLRKLTLRGANQKINPKTNNCYYCINAARQTVPNAFSKGSTN